MLNSTLNTNNFLTEYPSILNPKQVKTILNIGTNAVYNLLHSGELKSIKVNNQYKIPKLFLINFLNSLITTTREVCTNGN